MAWGIATVAGAMAEAPSAGLDGATGHVFRVDGEARSFELLKATEYDPQTDTGRSRFTIHWDDGTRIVKLGEANDFGAFAGPVRVEFRGIDPANRKAMKAGKAFVARVATIFAGAAADAVTGVAEDGNVVTGWFRVGTSGGPRSGHVELGGKSVPVSLRARNWRIFVREPLSPEALAEGFWKVTLHGRDSEGRFVAGTMEVEELPDPRASDDPELPRVLVIGDSISMNYHEAAKEALKGVANYHRNEGNASSTAHGVLNAELWLGEHRREGFGWDVIQFNHGLHDLKQAYDAETGTFGEHSVPLEEYRKNLEKEIAILKKTGARLIWCSTTPVPNDRKGPYARRKGAAKVFNEAAMEVMRRHPDILVTDLHEFIGGSEVFDAWRQTDDVHFYREKERKAIGEAVAAGIRRALAMERDGAAE